MCLPMLSLLSVATVDLGLNTTHEQKYAELNRSKMACFAALNDRAKTSDRAEQAIE